MRTVPERQYLLWSKKLICGFLFNTQTKSINDILTGTLPTRHQKRAKSPHFTIENIRIVPREIKIIEGDYVNHRNDLPGTPPQHYGVKGTFVGKETGRSLEVFHQFPTYHPDQDYIWRVHFKYGSTDPEKTLNRLKMPFYYYDLEYLCGYLEQYAFDDEKDSYSRNRAALLLAHIRLAMRKKCSEWQYQQFDDYFNGIAIYKP